MLPSGKTNAASKFNYSSIASRKSGQWNAVSRPSYILPLTSYLISEGREIHFFTGGCEEYYQQVGYCLFHAYVDRFVK